MNLRVELSQCSPPSALIADGSADCVGSVEAVALPSLESRKVAVVRTVLLC